jgi:hypothetical protein
MTKKESPMKLTHLTSHSRIVLACAVAVLAAALGASARAAVDTSAAQRAAYCPSAGSLVSYTSVGATAKTVVVQRDGRVWLCWNSANGEIARAGFVLSKADLAELSADLRQIKVRHLVPCQYCDPRRIGTLSLRGATLTWAVQQPTPAAAAALGRAELMIDLAAERQITGE